jgi:CRP-like cAMP-binding protein
MGQQLPFVYFPETVVISQLCYLEDGSSTGVSIVGDDGLLGLSALLASQHAQFWAVATIGGSGLRIRVDDLRRDFVKGGPLQKLVLNYTNARLFQLAQRTVCNSRHHLEERLCTWLLMIQDRAHSSELPLTHEAISQHLGTRRAGVTNFCNVLRDNKVISYHRAMITILDRKTLEDSACECYRRIS